MQESDILFMTYIIIILLLFHHHHHRFFSQQVILGYDCMTTGGELAEAVLAIAGVPPQHNSPDRDEYIQVLEKNIVPGKRIC